MGGAIRTWWWAIGTEGGSRAALERIAKLLAGVPIRAVIASSPGLFDLARALAADLGASAEVDASFALGASTQSGVEGFAASVARFGGAQAVVLAPLASVSRALARALRLDTDSCASFELTPDSLTGIDWPSADDPDGRPALVGIDLDWRPPPPARKRARFPGGPGSAPSARG